MQKDTNSHSPMNQIKLCGYLKKKRNKVGGWRKLWFVLHDRLLVSYSSQEEYDNKLASFKDVLNLVPGTQVHPMDGCRFTIETTTHVVYTFHCDDHMAYRQWIAMLLNCAGGSSNRSRRFHYFSAHCLTHDVKQAKIKNCDSPIDAEHSVLRKCTSKEKEILEQNYGNEVMRKPTMNLERKESQTLKKQIERMNISGTEEYKNRKCSNWTEERSRYKMVSTQSMEQSLIQLAPSSFNVEETCPKKNDEPVYAVVDLKHKYDQRRKRSTLMKEKRCNSYETIYGFDKDTNSVNRKSLDSLVDTIYEDGDIFFVGNTNGIGLVGNAKIPSTLEEENIYEPINVGQKSSMFEFRKYISRLKLNPFMRTVAARKLKVNCLESRNAPGNSALSRFSTLRWKLGKHRKSMQRRMRKLCSNEYEPNPLFQYHAQESSNGLASSSSSSLSSSSSPSTEIENPIKSNELEIKTMKHLNQAITIEEQTENTKYRLDNLPSFKRAVAKIPLFNIAATRNGRQSPK